MYRKILLFAAARMTIFLIFCNFYYLIKIVLKESKVKEKKNMLCCPADIDFAYYSLSLSLAKAFFFCSQLNDIAETQSM